MVPLAISAGTLAGSGVVVALSDARFSALLQSTVGLLTAITTAGGIIVAARIGRSKREAKKDDEND